MRGLSKPLICQVLGCQADLSAISNNYCRKKRSCPAHLAAASVQIKEGGPHMRFCQQCGKFELLSLFDGDKRSCRNGLLKRRSSEKRKLQTAATGAGDKCKTLSCTDCCQRTAYSTCCSTSGCCGLTQHEPAADMAYDATQCATHQAAKKIKKTINAAMPQQHLQQQQLKEELLWSSQQQQQVDAFPNCKDYHAAEVGPEPAVPHDIVSRAVFDVAAELAFECQLQQQKAAAAAAASTAMAPAYLPGSTAILRTDSKSDSGSESDASRDSMLLAAPQAAAAAASCAAIPTAGAAVPALTTRHTAQYTENALDELLDVLYAECAAEAAAATGSVAFRDPTAAVSAALQCSNSSPTASFASSYQHPPWALTPAPVVPALPAAAAAGVATQQHIRAMHQQIASLQAQLLHLQHLTATVRQQQQHLQYCI